MKKSPHTLTGLLIGSLLILGSSCTKAPVPGFKADKTTVEAGESVQFTDLSTNDPSRWEWTFEGGNPSSSRDQNPVVFYNTPGTFSVSLEASLRKDGEILTKDDYITVIDPNTDVVFVNESPTTIEITVDFVYKQIPSGDSVTYFDLDGNNADVYAYTSGEDSGGDPIGIVLEWDFSINLDGGTNRQTLYIPTTYFFLKMTNDGTHNLTPLVIYDGDTEPWTEEGFYIPPDGVTYTIGYYHAYESTHIRAYYEDDPEFYTYWDHNVHFFFPNEDNQVITVSNPFKKSLAIAGSDKEPGHTKSSLTARALPIPSGPDIHTRKFDKNSNNRVPAGSK